MTKEISLSFLLKVLKSAWWKILIITVVVALAVAAFTEFVIPKKYQSSVEFYILNASIGSEYTNTSLLSSAEYLANDYIRIINSDQVIGVVQERLKANGVEKSPGEIRSMLSSSISQSTSTFTITVTSKDDNGNLANYIASVIEKEAPDIMREITKPIYRSNYYKQVVGKDNNGNTVYNYEPLEKTDLECVIPLRSATNPNGVHSSPSLVTYTLLGALLAAFVSYILFLILKMSDTTVRSESNIKELIDPSVTIIGSIPHWSVSDAVKKD